MQESSNIFVPDWNNVVYEGRNEIVFQERNRDYGAYVIRKKYSRTVIIALISSIILFIVVLSIPAIKAWLDGMADVPVKPVQAVEVTLTDPPPIDEKEPPPPPLTPPPPPIQQSIKFTPPEIKPDKEIKDEPPPPTQSDLKESNPGTVTQEGNGGTDLPSEVTVIDEPASDAPFLVVEQMPEFPGGEQALYTYIASVPYPAMARENEIQGVVYVEFVINKDGKVSDAKILKDIGGGCGEAALKHIMKMPPWKPGKQGGRAVPVRHTVKVNFRLK